jgi:hypothetical protein
LVFSVLWIGGVGVLTWPTFRSSDALERVNSEFAQSALAQSLPKKPDHFDLKMARDLERVYQAHKLPPNIEADYTVVRALYLQAVQEADDRRSTIRDASLLAFLPPAFVLAFGSALLWAFRGFRQ